MQIERQEQDWNELAELDPYWAILTSPGKRFGRWDSGEFFATGKAEVDALLDRVSGLGLPQRRGRALDFGCGLGRVTRALADHFDESVGVDISEKMVSGAREAHADVEGVSFVVNRASDLRRFADGSFDLVYSGIALQHVPDRQTIESYIAEFCRILRPGGLAVFNLPSHIPAIYRLQWRRRLYLALRRLGVSAPFLYRRLHLLPIAMSYIPEGDIIRLVGSQNAQVVAVETQRASGLMNAGLRSSTYYVALHAQNQDESP
jgi:ubiquinone/menaquinone biosynthesis C-methylase UbiE